MEGSDGEITRLLAELGHRGSEAVPQLFELLYKELRRIAQHHLAGERAGHTLQATALVNEAYLKLVGSNRTWRNRAQFFGAASSAIRRILVDHARARRAAKRPGSRSRVSIEDAPLFSDTNLDDILWVDGALGRLSALDQRQSRIVELRYFGGLTVEEIAHVLGVSPITVQRDWLVARAWLTAELSGEPDRP
jgi:RNA polymerase sigma factor (TIGR02999 family)